MASKARIALLRSLQAPISSVFIALSLLYQLFLVHGTQNCIWMWIWGTSCCTVKVPNARAGGWYSRSSVPHFCRIGFTSFLFFLGLLLWGWWWKHMVELGCSSHRKGGTQHFAIVCKKKKKGLVPWAVVENPETWSWFGVYNVEGDTGKAEKKQLWSGYALPRQDRQFGH